MDEDVKDGSTRVSETGFAKPSHETERQLSTDGNEPIAREGKKRMEGGIFLSFFLSFFLHILRYSLLALSDSRLFSRGSALFPLFPV